MINIIDKAGGSKELRNRAGEMEKILCEIFGGKEKVHNEFNSDSGSASCCLEIGKGVSVKTFYCEYQEKGSLVQTMNVDAPKGVTFLDYIRVLKFAESYDTSFPKVSVSLSDYSGYSYAGHESK